jgi:hypothetical protein
MPVVEDQEVVRGDAIEDDIRIARYAHPAMTRIVDKRSDLGNN